MAGALQGQVIVNTRPGHQQGKLTDLLEAEGACVLSLPAVEIVETATTDFLRNLAARLVDYQIAIFVSRNAVDGVFRFLGKAALPRGLQLGVIGGGTRSALAEKVDDLEVKLISSDFYDSEGLLDAQALQRVDGQNILIFRGQQGRNLLGDELRRRGACVDYCEVYRRQQPGLAADALTQLLEGAIPTLILFTSTEGMRNLLDLPEPCARALLLRIPWLLISERMRESALKLGHNASIIIAGSASDSGIRQTICDWARQQQADR